MTSDYDERYLPSLRQILRQADSIGDRPMSDEVSRNWLDETVRENREAAQRVGRASTSD
jgi:hypothetical protein